MAFFPDLSPYSYGRSEPHPNILNTGWLSDEHHFIRGSVSYPFLMALTRMAETPTNLYRGLHTCEFCQPPADIIAADERYYDVWASARSGNGEIRVSGPGGIIYVAPTLIVHYITEHQYRPPQQFIDAVISQHESSPNSRSA